MTPNFDSSDRGGSGQQPDRVDSFVGSESTPPARTQRQKVLAMLLDGWTCGTTFLTNYLPRANARIYELRQDSYYIPRRRCQNPSHHHETLQWEWRCEAVPAKPEGEPCEACGGILAHVSTCQARELETADGTLPGICAE